MMLHACRYDVVAAIRQKKTLAAIVKGQAQLGRGPSKSDTVCIQRLVLNKNRVLVKLCSRNVNV